MSVAARSTRARHRVPRIYLTAGSSVGSSLHSRANARYTPNRRGCLSYQVSPIDDVLTQSRIPRTGRPRAGSRLGQRVPDFERRSSVFEHSALDFAGRAPDFVHCALDFERHALALGRCASGFERRAPDFAPYAPGFEHRAPDFVPCAPDFPH